MPYTDRKKQMDFIKESSVLVSVRFVKTTDAALLEWLDKQPRKAKAIKDVLREYIEEGGK